jgi:hypothetical protein
MLCFLAAHYECFLIVIGGGVAVVWRLTGLGALTAFAAHEDGLNGCCDNLVVFRV